MDTETEGIKLWKEIHGGGGREIAQGESAIFCSSLGRLSYRLGHIMAISSIYRQSSTSFSTIPDTRWKTWCQLPDQSVSCIQDVISTSETSDGGGQMFNVKLQHLARDTPIRPGHVNVDRKFGTTRAGITNMVATGIKSPVRTT